MILTDPKQFTPAFYKLFHYKHICQNCGKQHDHSEVTAMIPVASGHRGIVLTSRGELQYNLPVKVENLPPRAIPFCHECWKPGMLAHLPSPTTPARPVVPSWVGLGESGGKPKPEPKPKVKRTPTIDDLDID